MQQDVAELVDQAAVDASLKLIDGSSRQIGHNPANFFPDGPLRVVQCLQHGRQQAHVDQLLRLVI